jgi:hypothetical protein
MSFRVEECEHCGEDALGAPDEARQLHRVRGLERMAVAPSGRPAACAAPSADGRAALVGRRSLEFVAACGFINAKAPGYEAAFFRNCRRVRATVDAAGISSCVARSARPPLSSIVCPTPRQTRRSCVSPRCRVIACGATIWMRSQRQSEGESGGR